jgi:hypothetical protein
MTPKNQGVVAEMTDEQFQQHALEILQQTLGADGLERFVRTYRAGSGNYTHDRDRWQMGITVHEIVKDIKKRRVQPSRSR